MDASTRGIERLLLDGGPSRNPQLRAMLSAYIGRPVVHCADPELSALGVAHLAGLGQGLWDWDALRGLPRLQHQDDASAYTGNAVTERAAWAQALRRSRLGADPS
jgi:glycerol kinase